MHRLAVVNMVLIIGAAMTSAIFQFLLSVHLCTL